MTAITHALSAALLHFVWQGLAVTILLWLALWAFRKRSAALRYIVSCAALALLVLLPLITTVALYERPGVTSVAFTATAASAPDAASLAAGPVNWLAFLQAWAVPVWASGVLLFSIRMAWGCTRVAALRRSGEAAGEQLLSAVAELARRMRVVRPVHVLLSNVTDSPSVTGWLRPVLLLPVCAVSGLTPEQLEAVLAHELAHIRRHDYLVNLLQMAAETLLFYHPAVWWISARIRHERELCCDDLAVRATGGALSYARALTTLEKMRSARPALALGSTDGPLFYRIRRLVAGGGEYGPSKLSGAVALSLAVIGVALCINWARAQEPSHHAPGVTIDTAGATLLHGSQIRYPDELRSKGLRGTVALEATVDTTGQVIDAHVISGPSEFRRAALASVLNWHFAPGSGSTRTVHVSFEPPANEPGDEPRKVGIIFDEPVSEARRLDRQLEEVRNALDAVKDNPAEQNKVTDLAKRLQELEAKRLQAQAGGIQTERRERERRLLTGPLAFIRVEGLSEQAAADLRSRLPVHEGDTLTPQLVESAMRAVREFDSHLTSEIGREPQGAILLIHPDERNER